MLRKFAICALVGGSIVVAGCGGSDNSTSAEDKQSVTDLVAKLNQATKDKNASEFCLIMQPSAVDKTFHDIDRCVSETAAILKAAGEQPTLKIEDIEVDGDIANVTFSGSAGGEAQFVREDGQWYVPLQANDDPAAQTGTDTESGGD